MERARSGRTGRSRKPLSSLRGTEGSNPSLSVKRPKTPGAAPYLGFFDLDMSKEVAGMARTRSGSHLHRRGEIYYYRRIVPAEYRAAQFVPVCKRRTCREHRPVGR